MMLLKVEADVAEGYTPPRGALGEYNREEVAALPLRFSNIPTLFARGLSRGSRQTSISRPSAVRPSAGHQPGTKTVHHMIIFHCPG